MVNFCLFILLQSLLINGVHEAMRGKCINDIKDGEKCSGNILYPFKKWLSKYVPTYFMQPIGECVRCMSSTFGALTYFPTAIYFYGFHWEQIFVYIADVFILVTVNQIIYKYK